MSVPQERTKNNSGNREARKLISYKVLSTQSRDPIFCNTKITAAAQLGHKIASQKVSHFG